MDECFSNLPELFRDSVETISSYPSRKKSGRYKDYSKRFIECMRESERIIWVGTGRQEEMADFATRLVKAADKTTYCSRDSSIPYEYKPNDLVVALSSSGETERTIHYAESAYRTDSASTPVVTITTDPSSTLAKIAEKTGGFVVEIPGKSKRDRAKYQRRQFLGEHEALTLGGTLGELYTLEFILDSVGSAVSQKPVLDYHKELWDRVINYDPDIEQFEKLYTLLPRPVNYSKTGKRPPNKVVVGGLGLSGVVARTFAIRFTHCAKEDEERRVNFYKDAGCTAVRDGDLVLVFSGSGLKFWKKALAPIKEAGGKIVAITSFKDSPLGKIADICIEVPGRKKFQDRGKLENPPRTPDRALFEIRTLFVMETFIYILVRKQKIPLSAVESKHPEIT